MSFTYSGDPSESTTTQVRFLIGDTNEDAAELQDEEIEYLLTEHDDSVGRAAINALEQLATKYARKPSFSMEGASVSYQSVAEAYRKRADELRDYLHKGTLKVLWQRPQDQWGNDRDAIWDIGMHDFPPSADTHDRFND